MTEEEFLSRWYQERPSVEAWGKFVAQKLTEQIAPLVAPVSADIFVRIPAVPRVKGDGSILTKAFYRGKNYADPLNEITDKVGVRFVVLLDRDIATVCRAIEECEEWEASTRPQGRQRSGGHCSTSGGSPCLSAISWQTLAISVRTSYTRRP
jgi:putative GTP pyrophosphokinase